MRKTSFIALILALFLPACEKGPETESGKTGNNTEQTTTEDPGQDPGENPGTDPGGDPGTDPGEDPGQDPGGNPGGEPLTLSVGDYYDGGIVFAVGDDYAKLVSVDEVSCFWAQESVSTVRVGTQPTAEEGYDNTVMFKERADMDQFEAAAWCIYKEGGDWYLPSRTELVAVVKALKLNTADGLAAVSATCTQNGGSAIQSTYYWTSCEHADDAAKAWTVRPSDTGQAAFSKKGGAGRPVRAVKKISLSGTSSGGQGGDPAQVSDEYDIFLLIGQSNMAGRGVLLAGDEKPFHEKVYLLNSIGIPVPATNPLNEYSDIRKDVAQGINPGFSFSKKIADQTGRKVLLVVNARGGSALYEWKPSASAGYYSKSVARTKQAMKYGHVVAILWHQGESNSGNPDGYLEGLKVIVDQLRTDLKCPNAPFIAGEIAEWHSNASKFNPVIQGIKSVISNSDYVSSQGCGWLKDSSDPHFSRDGQILLGQRYADKVLQYCYKNQ